MPTNEFKGLVDHRGRPIRVSNLKKEIATATTGGARNPWFTSVANSLTPERLGTILQAVDVNDNLDFLTVAEEMEEREPHYYSVLSTRKRAVSGLEIVVEAFSDDAKDIEIADFVRDVLTRDEFQVLASDLLDGLAKGYSVSEIVWRRDTMWTPASYEWVDPRFFTFDRATGKELRLRDEANYQEGIELEPYKFVVHRPRLKCGLTLRGGLARLAIVSYMCKSYTVKDWLAFIEVFGMPLRIGRYDSTADDNAKATLLSAVARLGIDAAAIIPQSMEIEIHETGGGKGSMNNVIFSGFADFVDSQVSKAILGQTMTTDNGSSLSQAQVHNEVRQDIKVSDAKQLDSTIRRDLVRPLVDLNFPGPHEHYPIVHLLVEEPEDLVALATSLPPFIKLGLKVQSSEILDKFNLAEPEEGAEVLGVPAVEAPTTPDQQDGDDGESDDNSEPVDDEDEPNTTRALTRDEVVDDLLRRVHRGQELTPSQERVLEIALAQGPKGGTDTIDRLTDRTLGGWKPIIDPIAQPILDAVESARSYEDLIAKLEKAEENLDSSEFVRSLALSMFKARGLGDGSDKP